MQQIEETRVQTAQKNKGEIRKQFSRELNSNPVQRRGTLMNALKDND